MTSNATAQLHPAYGSVLLTMAIEPEEIGRRIRTARERKHWTQMDFALEAHVSLSSVARWEAGKLPLVKELMRIADVLGIPTETLVEPEAEPEDKFALIQEALQEQAKADRAFEKRVEARLRGLEDAIRKGQSPGQSPPVRGGKG